MFLHIIRQDITKVKADAIVNTANPHTEAGCGMTYAVYQAAGKEESLAVRKLFWDITQREDFLALSGWGKY